MKQFLELEELVASGKQNKAIICDQHVVDSLPSASDLVSTVDSTSASSSSDTIPVEISNTKSSSSDIIPLDSSTITSLSNGSPVSKKKSNETNETNWKPGSLSEIRSVLNDSVKSSRKTTFNDLPKSKSISVDFRLSRGISRVQSFASFCCF